MSIRWTRTTQISNGRFPEAISWAKEASAFVEKKFNLPKVELWIDAVGPVGTLRWTIDFPDLASFEKTMALTLMDADYWKMIEKAAKSQLFIDGKTHDTLSRNI